MLFIILILSFLVICFYGYWAHRFLHSKYSGRFNISHLSHHNKLYPPHDYLSETYRSAGKDDSSFAFALFASPLLLFPILLAIFHIIPLIWALSSLVCMLITGAIHNYIHEFFHLKNHWLNRFEWFRRLNQLHYLHHINQETNFGIFWFIFDRIFGTLRK